MDMPDALLDVLELSADDVTLGLALNLDRLLGLGLDAAQDVSVNAVPDRAAELAGQFLTVETLVH